MALILIALGINTTGSVSLI